MNGSVNHQSIGLMIKGVINEATPPTSSRFDILDPIRFPINIPERPFLIEENVTASSGRDVPKAMMLNPINCSFICNVSAIPIAELIKNFELAINAARENRLIPNSFIKCEKWLLSIMCFISIPFFFNLL